MANWTLGHSFANAIEQVIMLSNINPNDIDLIASHGQTIWHESVKSENSSKLVVKGTLQIGEASVMVERLGATVVADFRSRVSFFF